MIKIDLRSFPELPGDEFITATVYLEPMVGSGERIAVFVLVEGDAGRDAVRILDPETVERMFYKNHRSVNGIIEMALMYSREYIKNGGTIKEWVPPMDGFYVGELVTVRSESVEKAVVSTAVLHSCFFTKDSLTKSKNNKHEEKKQPGPAGPTCF